jgi:hypothetical protein
MAVVVTALLWPVNVRGLIPVVAEKIRIVASDEAVSTTCKVEQSGDQFWVSPLADLDGTFDPSLPLRLGTT